LSLCSPNGGNNNNNPTKKQGVCHTVASPFKLKSIFRQKKKKNYGNSNKISPCKNIINLQNNPLKETKILQDIITTL
jgi:hypothetical protein